MTLRAGVAGHPIRHSLSPLLHGAWIAAAGLDARYDAFGPETPEDFAALLDRGRAGELAGLNVTAPYKEQAFAAADRATATARRAGSANLLLFRDGRILADSTDGLGLMAALAEQAPALDVAGRAVVVLGAGGAARAAAAALVQAGAAVRIVNRTAERAERLAADLGPSAIVTRSPEAFDQAALVVNALSVPPDLDLDALEPATVVMDMGYRPLLTPLLAAARRRGLPVVDGLAMLIGQARPSFQALFGVAPPAIDVRALALAHLKETA
ncbi:MAG: NAD(P)-binding domain-containing protein [Brevundimonas sp.]|uniref:shikimate dehydrogenase family protein n=1 Tax=Brevundimonas sp. TaxID=1871086 RepID=UPI0025C3DECB|nr:NAD(P)-binding domain-containing protein [Brevundimonas sp.]MBX3478697.1 NAD(P)-binding domain-containing protein [Brevundimonas sp.]